MTHSILLTAGFLALASAALLPAQSGNLNIYWVDTEGGAATLIVTPAGESMLVDTGNARPVDRDAKRIFDVAQMAGLKKIDILFTSHYHGDHVGGAPALAKLIPIDRFLDHGESVEPSGEFDAYKVLAEGKRTAVKPGDKIPLKGIDAVVVSSNGEVLAKPINGGGPNPLCQDAQRKDPDKTENQRSAGILLTYGRFKFLDLADLTWDKEMELACPVNLLGTVSLFQATHHGFFGDFSGAPALVLAVRPQVVVVNNGPRKGWQPSAWNMVQKIPGLEGVWQSHLAMGSDKDHNTGEDMIANMEASAQCKGQWIKASIGRDGKYTVTNGRNGFSKTYTAR